MKIRLTLARMNYNPEIAWTDTKTVEVEIPLNKKGDWEVIGAEWPDRESEDEKQTDYYKSLVRELADALNVAQQSLHESGIGIVDDREVLIKVREALRDEN